MKTLWGRGFLVTGLIVAATIGCVLLAKSRKNTPLETVSVSPPVPAPEPTTSTDPKSNLMSVARNFGVRKTILTAEEKADLERKFTVYLKPAVDRWCKAYEGHTPIQPDQVTLDKFKETLGRNASFTIYTFVVNGITLCIQDREGRYMVNYLNSPQETKKLAALPAGTAPNLQLPVERSDVIKMVGLDSGTQFKPNEVFLRPAGTGSSLNGGALVDIGPRGGDPNNGLCKLSLVFDAEGKLAYYCRDPFF